jgi:hypothetical protein
MELLLISDLVTADEALDLGFLNYVTEGRTRANKLPPLNGALEY